MNPQNPQSFPAPGTMRAERGAAHDTATGASTRAMVQLARSDASRGWEALIERVDERLRTLAWFLTGSRGSDASVDDLLQETWCEAVRKLREFEHRGSGSFLRWTAGILRRKAHEQRRADARSTSRAARELEHEERELAAALARVRQSASADARRREAVARVRDVLASLPEREREAILMLLYEGLTLREAGARAGVDPTTVRMRFKRGLQRCAHDLRDLAP